MSHFDSASGLADRVVGAPSMVLLVTSVSDGGGSRPLSRVVVGELCPKHVSESCQLAAFQPVGAVVATWCYRFTVMEQ